MVICAAVAEFACNYEQYVFMVGCEMCCGKCGRLINGIRAAFASVLGCRLKANHK